MSEVQGGAPQEASKGSKAMSLLWSGGCIAVIVLVLAAISGPKLISARIPGNETAAIGALKSITTGQGLLKERGGERYGDLAALEEAELIDGVLARGEKQGYRFACAPATGSPDTAWWATAAPIEPGVSGDRYFAVNQEGVIHWKGDGPIAVDPATGAIPPGTQAVGR